jgi:uncharacterized protein YidB (DUF937 family)
MGLFDDLAGKLGGLLGEGGQTDSTNVVSALLQGGGAGAGGVGALLKTLAANGLGDRVSSWCANSGLPISPEEIHNALGSEQVQQMAANCGLPVGDFLKHLADHLPAAAAAGQDGAAA